MSSGSHTRSWEYLDDPWRRLSWIIPVSVLLWGGLLMAFATLLERIPPTPPPLPPAEVRFLELPPAPAPAGAPAAPAHRPMPVHVKPKVILHRHHVRIRRRIPTIAKPAPEAPAPAAASSAANAQPSANRATSGSSEPGRSGSGIGRGVGSDSGGARAIYAPKPVIPDDLRDQMIQTVAVAHFEVASNGNVQVSLLKPTRIPELNQILLNTLKEWRFFPAIKNGVAVNSQFDLRIPISVQ